MSDAGLTRKTKGVISAIAVLSLSGIGYAVYDFSTGTNFDTHHDSMIVKNSQLLPVHGVTGIVGKPSLEDIHSTSQENLKQNPEVFPWDTPTPVKEIDQIVSHAQTHTEVTPVSPASPMPESPGVVANWEDISYGLTLPANLKNEDSHSHGIVHHVISVAQSIKHDMSVAAHKVTHSVDIAKNATDCMAIAIAGEARGEVVNGQVGVANVVYNRVNNWGGTHCSNVFSQNSAGCQFYGACRHYHFSQDVMDRARTIASAQLSGKLQDVTGGALYFHVCQHSERKGNSSFDFATKIEHHCYYRGKDTPAVPLQNVEYSLVHDENAPYNYRLEENPS